MFLYIHNIEIHVYMPLDKNKEVSIWRYLAAELRNHSLASQGLYIFYFVFMFTTSSKNCSNNKLIEQPHRYYCHKKVHFQPEKFIIIRITSTKLNDVVRSHYLHFAKQSQEV